jgi:DNA polymerase V
VVRASGQSLTGLGIHPGDYLVVDRSRLPRHGDVVLALVDGSFTAKQYRIDAAGTITPAAANTAHRDITWRDGCEIWGVVSSVHRDLLCDACG